MNFKLTIQYDGTDFHGWQMQGNDRTVQGELTRVLTLLEGRAVVIHGSGRTDAGVHAESQVANVHLRREMTTGQLRAAINGNLPVEVRVLDVSVVHEDFHARYSARGKTYVYRILNSPVSSPFWSRFALHETRPLDIERMRSAGRVLLGEHDWGAFSSAQSEARTRVRTIYELEVTERYDHRARAQLIEITTSADGFLRYMVRSIAGTLLSVGRKEMDLDTVERALNSGDRSLVGATAPAHGLALAKVEYD